MVGIRISKPCVVLLFVLLQFVVEARQPTAAPSTSSPTSSPTTSAPTSSPTTRAPTSSPTLAPTSSPTTRAPTATPTTASPTATPTTGAPTLSPTVGPTLAPTTRAPTLAPTTAAPTFAPTTSAPTRSPTFAPTTAAPTRAPTRSPTASPTFSPTSAPTVVPTPAPPTSMLVYCGTTSSSGGTCTSSDSILTNDFVNLGVVKTGGWFWITSSVPNSIQTSRNNRLGIMAKGATNAWSSVDLVGGSGTNSADGWIIQWTSNGNDYRVNAYVASGGTLSVTDPSDKTVATASFTYTSRTLTKTSRTVALIEAFTLGRDVAPSELEVTIMYQLGPSQKFYTTTVQMRNIAGYDVTNVYYMRVWNPVSSTTTYQWVRYQPYTSDGVLAAQNSVMPYASLVISKTSTSAEYMMHAAVHPYGRVNVLSTQTNKPQEAYGTGTGSITTYTTSTATGTAGGTGAQLLDQFIYITFLQSTLTTGAPWALDYIANFDQTQYDTVILPVLAGIEIISPVEVISGAAGRARFAAYVNTTAWPGVTVNFQLYNPSSNAWLTVGNAATQITTDSTQTVYQTTSFSTTSYSATRAQVQVEVITSSGQTYYQSRVINIANTGSALCFGQNEQGGSYIFSRTSNYLNVTTCTVGAATPSYVEFYRDALVNGVLDSKYLHTDPSSPYEVTASLSDMSDDTIVIIRAVGRDSSNNAISSATFMGYVNVVNNPPTDITMSATSIAENVAVNTVVGTFSSTDLDTDQTQTYTLITNENNAFSISGTALVSAITFDYETKSSYSITVQTSDGQTLNCCFQKSFTITVADKNDYPSAITPTSIVIPENFALFTSIQAFTFTDQDATDTHTASLVANFGKFDLSPTSISNKLTYLQLKASLDYETTSFYSLSIRITDSGTDPSAYSTTTTISVTITDVNESPTGISFSCGACSIRDDSTPGTVVANMTAIDQDLSDTHVFTLLDQTAYLGIVGDQIIVNGTIDYYAIGTTLTANVRVTDSEGYTATQSITFTIQNVRKIPGLQPAYCYVDENRLVGDTVASSSYNGGQFCQAKVDQVSTYELVYSFVGTPPANGNIDSAFEIQSCSGILFVNNSNIDYETLSSYVLDAMVTAPDGKNSTAKIYITVVDVNEAPQLDAGLVYTVLENSGSNTVVIPTLLSHVFDPDAGDTHTFEIASGDIDYAFTLANTTTGQMNVSVGANIDYESLASYSLKFRVTDSGSLYDEQYITVNVIDVNEPPVLSTTTSVFANIDENSANFTTIASKIFAQDPDIGDVLTYTIVGNNTYNAFGLNSILTLGVYAGELYVANSNALDYETTPKFWLIVTVRDSGVPQYTDTATYIVKVNDVNEAPTLGDQDFYVAEDITRGYLVGTPLASLTFDPDANDGVSFLIASYGTDSSKKSFTIDSSTGQIELSATSISYETTSLYTYTITVTDLGGLSDSASIRIHVTDVPEAPNFYGTSFGYILENNGSGVIVSSDMYGEIDLRLTATDEDTGDVLTFGVVTVNGVATSSIFAASTVSTDNQGLGYLIALVTFNYEDLALYTVVLSVTDGTFVVDKEFTIQVVNQNDPPTFPSISCQTSINAIFGDQICSFSVTDEDSEASGFRSITFGNVYAYVSACGSHPTICGNDVSSYFSASKTSSLLGTLSLAQSLSGAFGTADVVKVEVTATDGGNATATGTITVSFSATNTAPQCPTTAFSFPIAENTAAPVTLGALVTGSSTGIIDAEGNLKNITLLATGDSDGYFSIVYDASYHLRANVMLDYETRSTYLLQVEAVDTAGAARTCSVSIYVSDVNEAVTLNDQARYVNENVATGLLAGVASISFYDPDAADQSPTWSMVMDTVASSTTYDPFTLDSSTGYLSLAAGKALDYESHSLYVYTVTWLSRGISASAKLTVYVNDVAEAPVVYAESIAISETTTGVIGAIKAIDPDYANYVNFATSYCTDQCGLRYAIVSGSSGMFTVDASVGTLSVASGHTLDFENMGRYSLTVRVTDQGGIGLSATNVITINITDVADCSITQVYDDTFFSPTILPTAGGSLFYIEGTNLGPTLDRLVTSSMTDAADVTIGLTYRDVQNAASATISFTAVNCSLDRLIGDNTFLTCYSAPGVGAYLGTEVTITVNYPEGVSTCIAQGFSNVNMTLSYDLPTITSISDYTDMPTNGSRPVTIDGTNFGPFASYNVITAKYGVTGSEYSTTCTLLVDSIQARCIVAPGVGKDLYWRLYSGNAPSNLFGGSNYAAPEIYSLSGALTMNTRGNEAVTIHGQNFGPLGTAVTAAYGKHTCGPYDAASCSVTVAHTQVTCMTSPGVGADNKWCVTVGAQESATSYDTTAYIAPYLTSVTGPGATRAKTAGGDYVNIAGNYFGPKSSDGNYSYIHITYGKTATEFTAVSCRVVTADVLLQCFTGTGTGTDLDWKARIDGQWSPVLQANTSYAAPVVGFYAGPGFLDGDTRGGQGVTIFGENFGPISLNKLEEVTYFKDSNHTIFVAQNCSIIRDNTEIFCDTVPGAGDALSWIVVVDGQASVLPSTDYAPPLVYNLTGPGAVNGSVYGGQAVTIIGNYFGPPASVYGNNFLDSVTYGATGKEYTAVNCDVISHQEITCETVEGVGSEHRWIVTIAGQESALSDDTTSYAPPMITSASPLTGVTDGGYILTITGSNFATFALPKVYFNGVAASVLFTPGVDILYVTVPEGYGENLPVYVTVGGVKTATVYFSYTRPHIDFVNSRIYNSSTSTFEVIIQGYSFSASPQVFLEARGMNNEMTCPTIGHSYILCRTQETSGNVTVLVGGTYLSNKGYYDSSEPVLLSQKISSGTARTIGGATLQIVAQGLGSFQNLVTATVGAKDCTLVTFDEWAVGSPEWILLSLSLDVSNIPYIPTAAFQELTCTVPAGEGKQQSVTVLKNNQQSLGCGCADCSPQACFNYLPPVVSYMVPANAPTSGSRNVTVVGDNFGFTRTLTVGSTIWTIHPSLSNHTHLHAEVVPGEGAFLDVTVAVAGQTVVSNELFSYDAPTITDTTSLVASVPTSGNTVPLTIFGTNFGISGPTVTIGGVTATVNSFTHTSIALTIPPGQGENLLIVVTVANQMSTSLFYFTYIPPVVASTTPATLTGETVGGRVSGETITLTGTNFGLVTGSWYLALEDHTGGRRRRLTPAAPIIVTSNEIVSWTHTQVVFYLPEGQGQNKTLVFQVGGQDATFLSGTPIFSYEAPIISSITSSNGYPTKGGVTVSIHGLNFGISGASVSISDPLKSSNNSRISNADCTLLTQNHTLVTCTLPKGYGADLILTLYVDNVKDSFNISYNVPVVSTVRGTRGNTAAGGEVLVLLGYDLGETKTPVTLLIDSTPCVGATWVTDDADYGYLPYVKCPSTPPSTVGTRNITLEVAYQTAKKNVTFTVSCKAGYFGAMDEYCTNCGDPAKTGMLCENDNMMIPVAYAGWWITYEIPPFFRCSKYTFDRPLCPALWPCVPSDACLGNNTCARGYDRQSDRCGLCVDGFYKLNGRCAKCPDAPWLIFVTIILAGLAALYVGYMLAKKEVNVGILSIGVDYFQVLAIFSNSDIQWPRTLVYLWTVMSSFNLNIDIFAPDCWNAVKISYKTKWILIMLFPVFLVAMASGLFIARIFYKLLVQRRTNKMFSHGYKLFGTAIVIFYYLYLYISNTALAIFNCQPSSPPDGQFYMQDVGTEEGLCYKPGTLQQELQPWAIACFLVYVVGFPVYVGVVLYKNRVLVIKDQLLRAMHAEKTHMKVIGTWTFRKRFQRMYYQFKPQYFYWILIILFRKLCLSVFAVVFRTNTIFMLAVVMLVLFMAYVSQVRHGPYMSNSEYDAVAKMHKPLVDELQSHAPKKPTMDHTRRLHKNVKFGDKMSAAEFRNLKMLGTSAFFNNYNTVEAILLCSAVMVALSGIMFESGQLSSNFKLTVEYIVILLVIFTILYFSWVLTTEIWIAFWPGTKICWFYDPFLHVDPMDKKAEDDLFEVSAGSKDVVAMSNDAVGRKLQDLTLENAVLVETVTMQQQEIAALKKVNANSEMFAPPPPKKAVKSKVQFEQDGAIEMHSRRNLMDEEKGL